MTTVLAHTPKGAIRVDVHTSPEILLALHADNAILTGNQELPANVTAHQIHVRVDICLEDGKKKANSGSNNNKQQQQPLDDPQHDVLAVLCKAAVRKRLQAYYTAESADSCLYHLQVYLTTVSVQHKLQLNRQGNCKVALEWFLSSGPNKQEIVRAGRTAKDASAWLNREKVLTEQVVPVLVEQLFSNVGVDQKKE